MGKHLFLSEIDCLLWFPKDPHFNQWMSKTKLIDYGILFSQCCDFDNGEKINTVLINWSNRKDTYAFDVFHNDAPKVNFHEHKVFKHFKHSMDGVCMKGGHMMLERPTDVIIFRMMYGDRL